MDLIVSATSCDVATMACDAFYGVSMSWLGGNKREIGAVLRIKVYGKPEKKALIASSIKFHICCQLCLYGMQK
jgi:hypothetical protein